MSAFSHDEALERALARLDSPSSALTLSQLWMDDGDEKEIPLSPSPSRDIDGELNSPGIEDLLRELELERQENIRRFRQLQESRSHVNSTSDEKEHADSFDEEDSAFFDEQIRAAELGEDVVQVLLRGSTSSTVGDVHERSGSSSRVRFADPSENEVYFYSPQPDTPTSPAEVAPLANARRSRDDMSSPVDFNEEEEKEKFSLSNQEIKSTSVNIPLRKFPSDEVHHAYLSTVEGYGRTAVIESSIDRINGRETKDEEDVVFRKSSTPQPSSHPPTAVAFEISRYPSPPKEPEPVQEQKSEKKANSKRPKKSSQGSESSRSDKGNLQALEFTETSDTSKESSSSARASFLKKGSRWGKYDELYGKGSNPQRSQSAPRPRTSNSLSSSLNPVNRDERSDRRSKPIDALRAQEEDEEFPHLEDFCLRMDHQRTHLLDEVAPRLLSSPDAVMTANTDDFPSYTSALQRKKNAQSVALVSSRSPSAERYFGPLQTNVNSNTHPDSNRGSSLHHSQNRSAENPLSSSALSNSSQKSSYAATSYQAQIESKIHELEAQITMYKEENEKLRENRRQRMFEERRLEEEKRLFEQQMSEERRRFEQYREEEMKKIKREKRVAERQLKSKAGNTGRKEREEVEKLRQEIESLKEEYRGREARAKIEVDRLRRRIEELKKENSILRSDVVAAHVDDSVKVSSPRVHEIRPFRSSQSEHVGSDRDFPRNTPQTFSDLEECSSEEDASFLGSITARSESEQEIVHPDGKREHIHSSGRRLIVYPNGTEKEAHPDGYSVVRYANGDVKEIWPSGKIDYYYASARTTHTTMPDGKTIFEFPNGQTEEHRPDGSKKVRFPDGTIKVTYANGEESTTFPDGAAQRAFQNGDLLVQYADGQRVVFRSDGTKEVTHSARDMNGQMPSKIQ